MVACDSLSRLEIEAESKIVNPILKDLSGSMKKIIKHKVLSSLVNEEEKAIHHKQLFEKDSNFFETFQ
jgi:hypothetical protein